MLAATENPHCPPMIKGDFNGDKAKDYALLLVGKNRQPQLVAALKSRSGWHTALLPTYCTTLDSCYLERPNQAPIAELRPSIPPRLILMTKQP